MDNKFLFSKETLLAKSFIHNEWMGKTSPQDLKVYDKYQHQLLALVPILTHYEIDRGIESSLEGFAALQLLSTDERRQLLLKLRDGIQNEREKFLNLIIAEAGKPRDYAEMEIDRSMRVLELTADQCSHFGGQVIPMDYGLGVGKMAMTKRFARGPVFALSPYNFPLNLVMHKLAPAIAVGASLLLRPSPFTPLTALALAELGRRVGFPKGAFNVVNATNEDTQYMVADPRLKMFSFTGSAKVGWMLKALANKKKVTLELGGNAAVIIDQFSDPIKAAFELARSAYLYAGQVCVSTQRIFIHRDQYVKFYEAFKLETEKMLSGDPREAGIVNGPLIDQNHFGQVKNFVQEALSGGAQLLFGGMPLDEKNHIYAPTLLTNTTSEMQVRGEEVFGPVAIIEIFDHFHEAIKLVNDSRYGLQVGLYSHHLPHVREAFDAIVAGAVIVNSPPSFRLDSMPYGGEKDSGFGREGVKFTMEEMTYEKLLVM